MSPNYSDHNNDDYGYDSELRLSYRRDAETGEEGRSVRPANRPSRSRQSGAKTKVAYNGIQRRRNKRWSW